MHYLTLLKIYKTSNDLEEKELTKLLDKCIFYNYEKSKEVQIHPFDLFCNLNLKNAQEEQKLMHILHLAKDMGMFKMVYEAYCPERLLPLQEVDGNLDYFEYNEEDCPYCGAVEHKIYNKDFVVSFKLIEQPIYKNFWNLIFKKGGNNVC